MTKLETDDTGRTVTGVVSRDGNREVYRADIVAVSAGAANSAKILLNSAGDQHPRGLANGSDQVGRNVVDTSFFPSIGAVNPALTAMANALRVGEHLLSRMA